jgi:hypothetical protein
MIVVLVRICTCVIIRMIQIQPNNLTQLNLFISPENPICLAMYEFLQSYTYTSLMSRVYRVPLIYLTKL